MWCGVRNLEVKRGAAFALTLVATQADGTASDLTALSVRGIVRDGRDVLVDNLVLVPSATVLGTGTITVPDTTGWPLGLLKSDLWVSDGVLPAITRTFGINVVPSVTYTDPADPAYNPVTAP